MWFFCLEVACARKKFALVFGSIQIYIKETKKTNYETETLKISWHHQKREEQNLHIRKKKYSPKINHANFCVPFSFLFSFGKGYDDGVSVLPPALYERIRAAKKRSRRRRSTQSSSS